MGASRRRFTTRSESRLEEGIWNSKYSASQQAFPDLSGVFQSHQACCHVVGACCRSISITCHFGRCRKLVLGAKGPLHNG